MGWAKIYFNPVCKELPDELAGLYIFTTMSSCYWSSPQFTTMFTVYHPLYPQSLDRAKTQGLIKYLRFINHAIIYYVS